MREFSASWKGNTSDKTGLATFTCGDKQMTFKMQSFEQFHDLCGFMDSVTAIVEKRHQAAIFQYINSYQKGY